MKRFSKIINFFKDNKKTYIIGILWLLAVDIAQIFMPKLMGSFADAFQEQSINKDILASYFIKILLLGIFMGVGRYFWRIYISGNSAKLEYSLRKDLFEHLLGLSPSYYNKIKTGDLMSHATNDIQTVRRSLGVSTIMFLDSLFILLLGFFMMVRTTNIRLTLIAAINFPIIFLMTKYFNKKVYNRSRQVQNSFSRLTEASQENFSGIRVIKAFSQEDLVFENFKDINKDNFDKTLSLVKVSGFFGPATVFIYSISLLASLFFGGRAVIYQEISLGDFIAFNSYLAMIHWPIRVIGQIINNIQRGIASLDRLNIIFHEESPIQSPNNPVYIEEFTGNLEFKNVYFSYPNSKKYSLENINFKLKQGESMALVGPTGSGKSTLTDLTLRLYDVSKGNIYIDGIDIRHLDLYQLRQSISYVTQDNFLFSDTIAQNIAFSKDYDFNKVKKAAKMASIYDSINSFPEGFETILGERGITLSGGQKQRIALARAFYKDSPLIILDDTISAVDTHTESKILDSLKAFGKEKTLIIISHRISSIKDVDKVLFLKQGVIRERGNHKELLALNGSYRQLYDQQLLEEVKEESYD